MELGRLVELVERVRATSRKLEKIALIAEFLRQTSGKETELAALYLTGALPQGRIGVGWRTIQAAAPEGAPTGEPLTLADVDRTFETVAGDEGAGSTDRKSRALKDLFARADGGQRRFLGGLLLGEIRQGALDGIVQDAIARAASLPPADVRQAAMYSGNLGEVARAALEEGAAGLVRFSLRCSRRSPPCWRTPPRTWPRRSSGWGRRPSSTRSTGRASRSTRPATRCGSSPASSRT